MRYRTCKFKRDVSSNVHCQIFSTSIFLTPFHLWTLPIVPLCTALAWPVPSPFRWARDPCSGTLSKFQLLNDSKSDIPSSHPYRPALQAQLFVLSSNQSRSSEIPKWQSAHYNLIVIRPMTSGSLGPCHHGMARMQVADGEDRQQTRWAASSILSKHSPTDDEGWTSSLGVGRRANNPSP